MYARLRTRSEPKLCTLCGFMETDHGTGLCWVCRGKCEHTVRLTGYIVAVNGSKRAKSFCTKCARGGDMVRGSLVFNVQLHDNRLDGDTYHCTHCDSADGVELHHWAPTAIFHDDAGNWPMDYLCKPCHAQWHATIKKACGFSLPRQA